MKTRAEWKAHRLTFLVITLGACLSARAMPEIIFSPKSQTIESGAEVTLKVSARGDGVLRYQWCLNGANIPGAMQDSLTIRNFTPLLSGYYQALVQDATGVAASDPAYIRVELTPISFSDDFGVDDRPLTAAAGAGQTSNREATSQNADPDPIDAPTGHSIWTQWTARYDGKATFYTLGSNFDTVLAVYTGARLRLLEPLAVNDDSGLFYGSQVEFTAAADQTYHIAVSGFGADRGEVNLIWDPAATGPTPASVDPRTRGPSRSA